ncbi:MAG: iron chaperone [Limisphaerales bacterium]
MKAKQTPPATIDDYIASFPAKVCMLLKKMRATIRKAAPSAEEAISYRIPTFKLNGNLVHFAAFKSHIGFYPTSSGIAHFKDQLGGYKHSKGAIQFPLDRPIPYGLVTRIVKFRVKESRARTESGRKRKQELQELRGLTKVLSLCNQTATLRE